ncbi:hypothetical protein PO909_007067 [Leuciscus waleckii]
MDRYRYFIFNQKSVVVLGILQVACAGLCVVCGFMDAVFRKSTTLSETRTPLWAGLIMAAPGVLALFASQKKNPILDFLVPQNDPVTPTELICTWQDGEERIFNSPVSFMDHCPEQEQQDLSTPPPYSRLA